MALRIQLLLLLSLSLLLGQSARAQTADDFFHGGAVNYLSNNIPKALEVVTNGLAVYPNDVKLKKLEELLKQQQQKEQQQQEEQKKQEEKKEQQSKQDQKDEQKKQEQSKEDQQKQQQQQAKSKPDDKEEKQQEPTAAHAMTPQEAQKLLDAQKGDEKVLQLVPEGEPKNRDRAFKDW
jgi:outer membrane biosynthesis protein TonB